MLRLNGSGSGTATVRNPGKNYWWRSDKLALQGELDMHPEASVASGSRYHLVPAPRPNEIWYHGRRGNIVFTPGRPAFFTRSPAAARWFSIERGEGEPHIMAARLDIRRPARLKDLLAAVASVGATEDDIAANSNYQGENEIDYLYVPKVITQLRRLGFNGYVGWDVLERDDIQIAVPFDVQQIQFVSRNPRRLKIDKRKIGLDLGDFNAMDVHLTTREALPDIIKHGLSEKRNYLWRRGDVDEQAAWEIMASKGIDYNDQGNQPILGTLPLGLRRTFPDPRIWKGASSAYFTRRKISPRELYIWENGRWVPLIKHRNPEGDQYGLHQYIIQPDGTALYIARIRLELYAIHAPAILEYLDQILKLPGVMVKERAETYFTPPLMSYEIRIDADSQRYTLTDDKINDILQHIDEQQIGLTKNKTTLGQTATETGRAWQGNHVYQHVIVTSKSMRRLDNFIETTWPTAHYYSGMVERFYRDEKKRRVALDYEVELFLDGPAPKKVGYFNF